MKKPRLLTFDDRELEQRLVKRTLELLFVPSVTGDEAALADGVERVCRGPAPDAAVHRIQNSIVVVPPARPDLPTLGLFGHLDTVKPAPDQPIGFLDGRIMGCGASDMKGALAVMLEMLPQASTFTAANPVFVFYEKEEGPWTDSGLRPVLESGMLPALDFGLCLEPTDNRVEAGCVGSMHARVTVHGRRAHSARPWQGDSAINRAIPLLSRLEAFGRRRVHSGGLEFSEVMNVTQAFTENSRNVIPDRLVLNVNYRFSPERTLDSAELVLREVLTGAGADGQITVEIIDRAPSGPVQLTHPLVIDWLERNMLEVEAKQAWTDVAQLAQAGIPGANFGPGETAQAHQANESVSVAYLIRAYKLLIELFTRGADSKATRTTVKLPRKPRSTRPAP